MRALARFLLAVAAFVLFALALAGWCVSAEPLPASGWESSETPTTLLGRLQAARYRIHARLNHVRWQWSPPRHHHACAVVVTHPNGDGSHSKGSGVYVRVGRVHGILTAAHCLPEGGATIAIKWLDGRTSVGRGHFRCRGGHDVGFVLLAGPRHDVQPLPVSDREPAAGEDFEAMGFGGPRDVLRAYWVRHQGNRESQPPMAEGDAGAMHGDSGGGLLTTDSAGCLAVASVVTNGRGQGFESRGGRYYEAMSYPPPQIVRDFARRVSERVEAGNNQPYLRPVPRGRATPAAWSPERHAGEPGRNRPPETQCPGGVCPTPSYGGYQQGQQPQGEPIYPPPENRYRFIGPRRDAQQPPPQQPLAPVAPPYSGTPWQAVPPDTAAGERAALHAKIDLVAEKYEKLKALFDRVSRWAGVLGGGGLFGGGVFAVLRGFGGRLRSRGGRDDPPAPPPGGGAFGPSRGL